MTNIEEIDNLIKEHLLKRKAIVRYKCKKRIKRIFRVK